MRHYSEEKGFYTGGNCDGCISKLRAPKLQVHRVDPNGNGGSNDAENLITVFECEHVGKRCDGTLIDDNSAFVIHPDMVAGFKQYRKGNKNAIAEVMIKRAPLKERGEIYWSTEHDVEMKETAVERTQNAVSKGWIYINKHKK